MNVFERVMDVIKYVMKILECVQLLFFLFTSVFALCLLFYILVIKTEQVTEFLAITDWFGHYNKISQRIRFNSSKVRETRAEYKDKPIREMVQKFNQLFREDFEKLFPKLKHGVKYRVVTHYTDVMKKAEAEHKIVIIGKPKVLTKRFLKELRPLVGWRDYRLIKLCYEENLNKDRCCQKCGKLDKCESSKDKANNDKPRRGERCKRIATKTFSEYCFKLADDHKE